MTRLRADVLLLLAAVIWGLAFVFQKTAMATIGPMTFIAARATVASVALLPFAWFEYRRLIAASPATGARMLPLGLFRNAGLAGVVFTIAGALQQSGLLTATATNAGFLTALYVVFTPLLAYVIRRTTPNPVVVPAVVLSALGTWLLGGGGFSAMSVGDWLVAACAVFWALHVLICEHGAAFDRPILFTGLQFLVVAGLAAMCAFAFESVTFAGLRAAGGEILYVGLLSSALTFTILTLALKYAPASEAAVIISTESVFAALAGAQLLGERLTAVAWSGAVLILAAVLLVQLAPRASKPEAA